MKVSVAAGMGVAGEGMVQISSALSGIYNIGNDISNIWNAGKPLDNEEELKQKSAKKLQDGKKFQTAAQQLVTKDNNLNKEWILNEVAVEATKSANYRDIMETATTCVNVLSGSSFGVQALTNVFVGGIRAAISETLNTARFLTSMWFDKKMMDRYFSDEGPLGEEIRGLRGENFRKITDDQKKRERTGSRKVLPNSKLDEAETKFIGKLSNRELFRRAYGFKDFTEEAAYVGWNIVQTLLQAASPFATDPVQFIRASLLLAAIGCKDVIGKQDNDSAQKVYTRLMGQDIR